MTIEQIADAMQRVRARITEYVVGQEGVIDEMLTAYLARGHVILQGVPGTAKTLLVRTLAGALNVRFGRIQFTPDLMPSDVTGVSVYREATRAFEFRAGPLFADCLLADEINRAPAKTQSSLLEAMQERQATIDGVTHPLGDLFTVFATQNPVEYEGTYPLPEAQLDRFLMMVQLPYPSHEAELKILDRYAEGFDAEALRPVEPVLDAAECRAVRHAVDTVNVEPPVREYIASIVRATRDDAALTLGGSPRATVALFRAARAAAVLAGRTYATPDDVKGVALPVLRHRLALAPELQVEGRSTDDVIDGVLRRVTAPR
jgi:MoxR-like ATPase